jgi:hypothetical protein
MYINQASLGWVFLQVLPASGLKKQACTQVGQRLRQFLFRLMQNDPISGYLAALFNRAPVLVAIKSMGKGENIFPSGTP